MIWFNCNMSIQLGLVSSDCGNYARFGFVILKNRSEKLD